MELTRYAEGKDEAINFQSPEIVAFGRCAKGRREQCKAMTSTPLAKSCVSKSDWQEAVTKYQSPELQKSIWQIANSILPYFVMWYLMYQSLSFSYLLTLMLAFPAAGLLMRIFIILHDCGHGSFFRSGRANHAIGTLCGILTLTPYSQWTREHALHHASSGDLGRRGVGDVSTLTVREYKALSGWKRFKYRFYRHPLVMLLIGPQYLFILSNRFVSRHSGRRERNNVYLTNTAAFVVAATLCLTIGVKTFLLIWIPISVIAGGTAVWLFYIQHQYETTYWQRAPVWNYAAAAMEGSSYYKLPRVLQWFSGNIGLHHVHHLSPKIPNYKLERCHNEVGLFDRVTVIGFWESFRSLSLKLWDEDKQRLVGFKTRATQSDQHPTLTLPSTDSS
jgi:omega-6 fatty acid desaturase (delta-12 desaturase)